MAENDDQTTPIEPLQLQEQEPLAQTPAAETPSATPAGKGGRIALTAVAAAALVALSGVTGYALGHQSGTDGHHDGMAVAAGVQGGQQGGRGVDPDGDNWTGGGRHMDDDQGMMGGGQGMMNGGQGLLGGGQLGSLPTTPQEFKQFLQDNNITSLRDLVEQYGPQALMLLQQMQSQSTQS